MTVPASPFHAQHEAAGARFVEFAGWRMPLHYGSITAEHTACRTDGAVFDVSHMGRVEFHGPRARRLLEALLTRRVSDMDVGQARYALVCNEAGGVLDDVLVYRADEHWLLVVNAANRAALLEHFARVAEATGYTARIDDRTQRTGMLALQGPGVMRRLASFSREAAALGRYRFLTRELLGFEALISRTGYTGEDGVEVIVAAGSAPALGKLVRQAAEETGEPPLPPAGLGARDTLRIEAGMPLYGHELAADVNPYEAGLGFAISLDKGAEAVGPEVPRFVGQDALTKVAADGPARELVGLQFEGRRTPRQGAAVFAHGEQVGEVTSGCLSPTLGAPIAMARCRAGAAAPGVAVEAQAGSGRAAGVVVELPFYRRDRSPAVADTVAS